MTGTAKGKGSVASVVRDLLAGRDEVSSSEVAGAAGVTRQAAHYHLRRMADAGEVVQVGAGRATRYARPGVWTRRFPTEGLEEHLLWGRVVEEVERLRDLADAPAGIARFAFTKMVNNAIDHSGSDAVTVSVTVSADAVTFVIGDDGVGAFERIRSSQGLEDHVAAIQELSKGKLTTDPARHSGQGIFFTSKAVDIFVLTSNGWRWDVDNQRADQAITRVPPVPGTQVRFDVDPHSDRVIGEIFDAYTDPETYEFDTTRTIVRLFEYGVSFVSRSEAKRLTRNLEKFREVIVDFRGVEGIGQGFADEIFRVWARQHPEVRLVPVNMEAHVRRFVEQARTALGRN